MAFAGCRASVEDALGDSEEPYGCPTGKTGAKQGCEGPFGDDLTHGRAERSPQDIPAGDLQVDRVKDPR